MLLMWGLSAPCMHAFLSRAGLSRPVSAAAALAFCILPYRISYVDEFQMQFAFGTPLVYLAILSFFSRPGPWRGAAVAATMWLYAVTELNQAVFIVFTFPFLAAAFLAANPRLLSDRRFWTGSSGRSAGSPRGASPRRRRSGSPTRRSPCPFWRPSGAARSSGPRSATDPPPVGDAGPPSPLSSFRPASWRWASPSSARSATNAVRSSGPGAA